MRMILIFLSIVIAAMFALGIYYDETCRLGFVFLSIAFLWLAFTDSLILADNAYRFYVTRMLTFKLLSLIGGSLIVYEHRR